VDISLGYDYNLRLGLFVVGKVYVTTDAILICDGKACCDRRLVMLNLKCLTCGIFKGFRIKVNFPYYFVLLYLHSCKKIGTIP